ncbi:GNAT family N-acetyltransferase [Desulfosporosinus lacus]|uniref:Protein N-acetyltransferase, RimJ/RimL family n=1 Tax=Desulfosporosinus lacus DSM 15449 TaxID=1121420 RepID=A0A1M5UWJ1_9FIRM|nr:GNAT family N-acetyltransferase [Desulfosporosinus lacus]SHH67342.1 Protein N-acetyltransferase, RimJ/RimL family [Desulfosporosinus lacus DSM 15449]
MTIYLKEATVEDVDLLFEWVNEKLVRKSAFNSNTIAYGEHTEWFFHSVESPNCRIFIGYDDDNPIGQIRIDLEDDKAVIDYSVDSHYRGKGYGVLLLEALENEVRYSLKQVKQIVGKVKFSNISSQRTFNRSGYITENKNECILFYKKLGGYLNE